MMMPPTIIMDERDFPVMGDACNPPWRMTTRLQAPGVFV